MITDEEYKKWKPLIEEYEENEFQQAQLEGMYCTSCQALVAQECFCDEDEEEEERDCSICCGIGKQHAVGCPYNTDPYDNLITNGYD